MYDESIKKWTILIYADGNNEMEDIIYKSFLDCEKIGSSNEVNVVIQIGKLGNYNDDNKGNWSGVRRYYVQNNHSILIQDLGKTNIANPNVLYDFIKWGYENYKAEHVMLVLSDHGGDFIGCLPDLSLNVPYIMGIPEMIEAINAVRKRLGYVIDILLLDMCYMNSIEVLYELGQEEHSTIKTSITYMDSAPYEGISYCNLISTTQKYNYINDNNMFIKFLIDNQDYSLIAYKINHEKLKTIKFLINNIGKKSKKILDILANSSKDNQYLNFFESINDNLKTLVIYSKEPFNGLNSSINITCKEVGRLIVFYEKLAFAKNNSWKKLINKVPIKKYSIEKDRVNVSLLTSSETQMHYILKFNK